MWNLEQPKSLEEVKEQLITELDTIDDNANIFLRASDERRVNIIEGLIRLLSLRVQEIRQRQLKTKKRLAYNIKKNQEGGTLKRYQHGISVCKTYLYSMYLWIEKTVSIIGQMVQCSAMLQGTLAHVSTDRLCNLTSKSNVRILHEPITLISEYAPGAIPATYIKQRSPEWHSL